MKTFLNFHSFYWVRGWGTPGGPCKGGSNRVGLEGQQGRAKIFFDEFSTALLFFLILKKAFFVVFYAVCQKKEKLGNNEKTTLIFPGKNRLNYETKNKNFHDGTFNFFFFWSNQKNFFQPRKEPTLNVCIFFTLFYYFFFCGWVFYFFFGRKHCKRS